MNVSQKDFKTDYYGAICSLMEKHYMGSLCDPGGRMLTHHPRGVVGNLEVKGHPEYFQVHISDYSDKDDYEKLLSKLRELGLEK